MPTIFIAGFKFRFYSSDIHEPPHVHVIHGENVAKIWIERLELENNHGYNRSELSRILRLTRQHQARLLEAWHAHFNQEQNTASQS